MTQPKHKINRVWFMKFFLEGKAKSLNLAVAYSEKLRKKTDKTLKYRNLGLLIKQKL